MQLSLHTDYALRVLMALAATDRQMTIDEVAGNYRISRNHLAKVAQGLQSQGLIETTRGRSGGMRLARDPGDINVGAVVRKFERFEGFVACMGGAQDCAIDGACGLKSPLAGALQAFLTHLDQFTLADLVDDQKVAMLERIG